MIHNAGWHHAAVVKRSGRSQIQKWICGNAFFYPAKFLIKVNEEWPRPTFLVATAVIETDAPTIHRYGNWALGMRDTQTCR